VIPNDVQYAEVSTLVLVGAMLVLSAAATLLVKKPKRNNTFDATPPSLTTRGSYLPIIIGSARVSPMFMHVADRKVTQQGGGGAKKFGGGGQAGSNVYSESAFCPIAVGPLSSIEAIYQNGEMHWQGPITRENTPSGSEVITKDGSFFIYWGEEDQPVDPWVSDRVAPSRWPGIAYMVWINKTLGGSPLWPQIEVDATAKAVGSELQTSPEYFEGDDQTDRGINLAHAIYRITTGKPPYGAGDSPAHYDFGSLEDIGGLFETEGVAGRVLIEGGETATSVLARILYEHGLSMPQVGERIVFIANRETDDLPAFAPGDIIGEDPEQEFAQGGANMPDRATFVFKDRTQNYRPQDISIRSDADARMRGLSTRATEVELTTVVDRRSGTKVAARLEALTLTGQAQFRFRLGWTARNLHAGMPFSITGRGSFRVTSREDDWDAGTQTLNCLLDQYSRINLALPQPIATGSSNTPPAPDSLVGLVEATGAAGTDRVRAIVMRIRANDGVGGATVSVSGTGSSYSNAGRQNAWVRGGRLTTGMPADVFGILDSFEIETFNADIRDARDVVDPALWMSGDQMAVIDDELFFLRRAVPVSATRYRLDGLVRARAGTAPARHASGSAVFIFPRAAMSLISHELLRPNVPATLKVTPDGTSIENATPLPFTPQGLAFAPPAPGNLLSARPGPIDMPYSAADTDGLTFDDPQDLPRLVPLWVGGRILHPRTVVGADITFAEFLTTAPTSPGVASRPRLSTDTYEAGQNLTLLWDYAVWQTNGTGAGEGLAGQPFPVDADGNLVRQYPTGRFRLEFLDTSGAILRTAYVASLFPTFDYTPGMRTADYGLADPPVIIVRLSNELGAYTSQSIKRTFYKV
jgi:hypothetical protein